MNVKDIAIRGGWTLAQAAVAFLTVELADLNLAVAPILAACLSFAKSYIAQKLEARRG